MTLVEAGLLLNALLLVWIAVQNCVDWHHHRQWKRESDERREEMFKRWRDEDREEETT